jgi:DNA-binding winged helix-turn-helix (wHTH) protein
MRIRFSDLELDAEKFLLLREGRKLGLRPKVFDLLIYLVEQRMRVVPRDELMTFLWGSTAVGGGSLSGLVNELRKALGERGDSTSSIRTVHARGYQFAAEIETLEMASVSAPPRLPGPPEQIIRQASSEGVDGRAELLSLFEGAGLGHIPDQLVDALLRWVGAERTRSDRLANGATAELGTPEGHRPERRMRVTRSAPVPALSEDRRR